MDGKGKVEERHKRGEKHVGMMKTCRDGRGDEELKQQRQFKERMRAPPKEREQTAARTARWSRVRTTKFAMQFVLFFTCVAEF